MRVRKTLVGMVLLGMLAAAAGCSGGGEDGDTAASSVREQRGFAAPEPADPDRVDGAAGAEAPGGGDIVPVGTAVDVVGAERQVIYAATVVVEVDDVRSAAAQARGIATGSGGRLHDETSSGSGEAARSHLVLKVPPERFDDVVDAIGALGDERQREVAADDVTAEVVDLDARIRSASASVERTRALLAEAETIAEIVSVESELAKREAVLEQLEGQRRVLESQVTLATVTVDLVTRTVPPVPAEDGDDGLPGPVDALLAGARSLLTVGNVVLIALALALPWMPVAAGLVALALWLRRRRTPAPVA